MGKIAKSGFYIFLISYIGFWMLDLIRPGFVARSFSVHLFLLAALVFGIWWSITVKEYTDRPWVQLTVGVILGILLSVITWNLGEGLSSLRLLIAAIAFFIPLMFWQLVRQ